MPFKRGPFDPNKYGKPTTKRSGTIPTKSSANSATTTPSSQQRSNRSDQSTVVPKKTTTRSESELSQTPDTVIQQPSPEVRHTPPHALSPPADSNFSGQSTAGSQHTGVALVETDESLQALGQARAVVSSNSVQVWHNNSDDVLPVDTSVSTPEESSRDRGSTTKLRDNREVEIDKDVNDVSTTNSSFPSPKGKGVVTHPQDDVQDNLSRAQARPLESGRSWSFSSNLSQAPTSEAPADGKYVATATPGHSKSSEIQNLLTTPKTMNGELLDRETEQKAHDESLKLYRKLSPEQKQALLKQQQDEIFQKTRISRERRTKGTTSLADLQIARQVPDNGPSLPEESSKQSVIAAAVLQDNTDQQATTNLSEPSKQTSFLEPLPDSPQGNLHSQDMKDSDDNSQYRAPALRMSKTVESAKTRSSRNQPKELDLGASMWSGTKGKSSPLRNAIVFSNESARSEKFDEKGWPLQISVPGTKSTKPTSQWVKNADIKPSIQSNRDELNSNAYGSSVPSDAHSSDDARKPMGYGKLFKQPQAEPENLANWDGQLAPPPVDWYERPFFNNNDEAFRNHFDTWLNTNLIVTTAQGAENQRSLPIDEVENSELCPDGIGFVTRDHTLDGENCRLYGYGHDAPDEIRDNVNRLRPEDFEDWGKVDMRMEMNALHNDETAHFLSQNYIGHKKIEEQKRSMTIQQLRKAEEEKAREIMANNVEAAKVAIKANLYIRPARREDMSELAEIYNHYILNSPRTTELELINSQIMEDRFFTAQHDKLPFFVALSRKAIRKKTRRTLFEASHQEKVLGYVLAQDFSGITLAERHTSELELYVHPDWVRKGVGKSLLDKVIEVCDPGWMARKGYLFTCEPDVAHMYGSGGQRDLISLIFVVRHYSKNKPDETPDYPWIKKWLEEDFGFKEQGYLQRCSVKHGRYANMGYLVRPTHYVSGTIE